MREAWLLLDARTAGYCHDNLCVTRIAKEREDFCSKVSKQRTMLQASPVTSIRPCKLIHLALSKEVELCWKSDPYIQGTPRGDQCNQVMPTPALQVAAESSSALQLKLSGPLHCNRKAHVGGRCGMGLGQTPQS